MAYSRITHYFISTASLIVGSLQSLFQSADTLEHVYHYHLTSNPETNVKVGHGEFKKINKKYKHAHMVINQAFQDVVVKEMFILMFKC